MLMLWGSAGIAFLVALIAVRLLIGPLGRLALDQPNARSLHQRPLPRTGGIAVLIGAAVAFGFGAAPFWLVGILALLLAVVSFVDDLHRLPVLARLAAHLVASGLLVWYVMTAIHAVEMVLLMIAVAWITDLYNFMDGSDGLAAGMATIGFGAYALAGYMSGDVAVASLSVALSASAAAFLVYNHHPARIFLGDVGSIPLGFLAAALGLVGWRNDLWQPWFPVVVFAPFIADATVTLLKRLVRGERVWQAHRSHYYQRMILMGLGHRRTAWIAYTVMAACAGAALAGRNQPQWLQAISCFGASALLTGLGVWVDMRWARFASRPEHAA